jgi:hypothetical protein
MESSKWEIILKLERTMHSHKGNGKKHRSSFRIGKRNQEIKVRKLLKLKGLKLLRILKDSH